MYSVLVCRWLQEINHKMSITQPFKKSDSEWNPKTKDTFSQWLLAACSLIWPCSAILKSTQHACIQYTFAEDCQHQTLTFLGEPEESSKGRTEDVEAEMGRGSTFIFIWPCNATTLQQTWLYHLTHGASLDTHVSLFRRLIFDNFQLLSNIKVFQLIGQIVKGRLFFYKLSWYQMCPKRTSVVQSLELNFFFRCLHDNPSGQKIPPAMYCYTTRSERELFWGGRQKRWSFSSRWVYNVKASLCAPCRLACRRRRPVCPYARAASAAWTTWQPGKPTLNRIAFPVGELGRSLRMSAISLTTSIHGPPGLYTSARKRPSVHRLT